MRLHHVTPQLRARFLSALMVLSVVAAIFWDASDAGAPATDLSERRAAVSLLR